MKKMVEIIYNTGLFIILVLTTIISLTGITFIFGGSIGYWQLPLSVILATFITFYINGKNIKKLLLTILLASTISVGSLFICSEYYDTYWDSNGYHKDAVGALKNGWNPIYQNYIDFYEEKGNRNMELIGDEIEGSNGFWQTHYTKGIWYTSANIYKFTNDIEMSKITNILLIYISFSLVLAVCYKYSQKLLLSFIVALLFSCSPVTIVQMLSYYNDGALYNTLLILVISLLLYISEKNEKNLNEILIWIFCSIVFISNIKFTGLGYGGIMCIGIYLYYLISKYKEKRIKEVIKPTIIFVSAVLFGVLVVGFQPYVTNTYYKGNPLYPLAGKDKVDIVTYNEPSEFHEMNTVEKFFISLFGKSQNINERSEVLVQTKTPFIIYPEEFLDLQKADLRISGFGLYFSGIFIISLGIITFYLIKYFKTNKKIFICTSILVLTITGLIVFISESWWARYTPFVYFVPLIAIFFLIKNYKIDINKTYFAIVSIIMILNLSLFIEHNLMVNLEQSRQIRKTLKWYEKKNKKITIVDSYNNLAGYIYTLEDRNIEYEFSTKRTKKDKELFRYIYYR